MKIKVKFDINFDLDVIRKEYDDETVENLKNSATEFYEVYFAELLTSDVLQKGVTFENLKTEVVYK